MNSRSLEGGITAFLSLTMILILALICTVIEGARVKISQIYAERSLNTAMDSVFTEYCLPLYKDYHLFFMEEGKRGEDFFSERLKEEITDYMQYTLEPNYNLFMAGTKRQVSNLNFYDTMTSEIVVNSLTKAMDYNGEIFIHEINEYMKYAAETNLLEAVKEQMNLVDEAGKTSSIVQEKLKAEESLTELNWNCAELLQLIEGITFGKNGLKYTGAGLVKTEENFIKQMVPYGINSINCGVDNEIIWKSLQNKYLDPIAIFGCIETNLESLGNGSGKDKKRIIEIQRNINKLVNCAKETKGKIKKALFLISELQGKQSMAEMKVRNFETMMLKEGGGISEDLHAEMHVDLSNMKSYIGKEGSCYDQSSVVYRLINMKVPLETNLGIIDKVLHINSCPISGLSAAITELRSEFERYQVKSLNFDYSSLCIKKDVKSPMKSLEALLHMDLLSLVMEDPSVISKKAVSMEPSIVSKKEVLNDNYADILRKSDEEGYDSDITNSFKDFVSSFGKTGFLGKDEDSIARSILPGEYVKMHFKNYLKTNKITRETGLEYENEYIIMGKSCDYDNLNAVITRVTFIRTIFNFLYLISDSKRGNLAYATAAALVGYTCLEPLVRLTKLLILLVWAFEEALVDTGAILKGKKMPLVKGNEDFIIEYPELITVSKSLIQNKINKVEEKSKSKVCLGYGDYLRWFTIATEKTKLIYRTVNLIEVNLRLTYHKDFSIENCIYGIKVSAQWKVPSKFIRFIFVQNILREDKEFWDIKRTIEYTY